MRYYRQLNFQQRKRFLLKIKLVFGIIIVLIVVAGVILFIIYNSQKVSAPAESTSKQVVSFSSSTKIFKTPYFQLELNSGWSDIPAESTNDKFVYRSSKSGTVSHELIVYVNNIPSSLASNHVLPVSIKPNATISPLEVSEHCISATGGPTITTPEVVMDNTKFKCDPDSRNYTVFIGATGGNTILNLKRPNGSSANYSLYYTNLQFSPDANEIKQIVQRFETR